MPKTLKKAVTTYHLNTPLALELNQWADQWYRVEVTTIDFLRDGSYIITHGASSGHYHEGTVRWPHEFPA